MLLFNISRLSAIPGDIRRHIIGLAESSVAMYIANACGLFAGLVQPAGVSFVVQVKPRLILFSYTRKKPKSMSSSLKARRDEKFEECANSADLA